MGRGALENEKSKAVLEQSMSGALGGSNISNYATDNASGNLAAREAANGTFKPTGPAINGETFFTPGTAEPGLAKRHKAWMASLPRASASADPNQVFGDGNVDGVPQMGPTPGQDPSKIPYREQGTLTMEGKTYHYASGGAGRGATPPGSYPVNVATEYGGKGQLGDIGRRIGSVATVGGLGGTYKDPRYAEERGGIQIHRGNATSDHLDRLQTEGCFGIAADEWPAYKAHLIDLNRRTPGGLRIDVDSKGRAQIVPRSQKISMPGAANVPGAAGGSLARDAGINDINRARLGGKALLAMPVSTTLTAPGSPVAVSLAMPVSTTLTAPHSIAAAPSMCRTAAATSLVKSRRAICTSRSGRPWRG